MVTYILDTNNCKLTEEERQMIAEAKKYPIVFDEDSPEMTPEMEAAFRAARKANPLPRQPLTLYVAPATLEKVKSLGEDYLALAEKLLDKAIDEYQEAL